MDKYELLYNIVAASNKICLSDRRDEGNVNTGLEYEVAAIIDLTCPPLNNIFNFL